MAATKFKRFLSGTFLGASNPRHETSNQLWKQPLRWAKHARRTGKRVRIFGTSLFDLFEDHPRVNAVRPRIWELVDRTRDDVSWQFCTKRPERIASCMPATWGELWYDVWLGTTDPAAFWGRVHDDAHAWDACQVLAYRTSSWSQLNHIASVIQRSCSGNPCSGSL